MRRLLALATMVAALTSAAPATGADMATTGVSIASPSGAASASTVAFNGETSPQDFTYDGVDNASPQSFSFNFDGTSVNNVMMLTSLRCPDGSYMNMGTHT